MQHLIITLSHHPRFDYLLQPVFASLSQNQDVYTITEVAGTATLSFNDLSESEQTIVKLAESYSIKNLMKSYSRTKREADFLDELIPGTIENYIRPLIEKKQREMVQMILKTKTPVFRRDNVKIRDFRVENAITVLPNPSKMFFIFRNAEIFTYQVKVQNGNSDIPLYGQFFASLVANPAVVVIGNQLHHFMDVDEKKLRPFIHQKQIEVPDRNVPAYIRGFVMQCVKNYDTRGEGLTIFESHPLPVAALTLETDFNLQPVLNVKFHYGAHQFHLDEPYTKTVELFDDNGNFSIGWFYRDEGWERERIRMLTEGGLSLTRTHQFMVENRDDHLNPDRYGVVEWINRNGELLSSFELKQSHVGQKYYLGRIDIQLNTSFNNDWFDIHCMVCFGEVKIPFILFKHYIVNNIREYVLPDGSIAILPGEWFFRFGDLFRYGVIEAGIIRLNRFHFRVKELVENGFFHDENLLHADAAAVIPRALAPIVRPYQVNGFRWLVYLHQNGFGGCLADDMGLGKTLQTIMLLLWQYTGSSNNSTVQRPKPRQLSLFQDLQADGSCAEEPVAEEPVMRKDIPPSLIVMPTSLIHNWLDEFKKFAPTLGVYAHFGSGRLRDMAFMQSMSKVHIILTSYGVLKQDIDFLRTCRFQYVILDESQYIKNPSSLNFICAKQLQATYRLSLTGTPLENALSDLWAQMDFLNEGILGKPGEFRSRYREANVIQDDGEQKKLLHIIQPFILRRTKEEVAPELPSLTSEIIYCTMKDDQELIYLKEKSKIRNALLEQASDRKGAFSAAALSGLTRLRLLANHPVISIPDYEGSSAKFEQIIENVEILIAERHKVLIFSSFVKHLKLLAGYFDDRNWQYAWLTGSTVDRQAAINKFSSDEQVHTFFISLKAGGTGLNLTAADYVFIIDPWWNPSAELQAVSRAHRIGQKKNVTLYRFITEGTIEEKIQQLQHYKTALVEGLIRPQFSEDEIKELLA